MSVKSTVNGALAPIHLKPFKGGNYSDNGMGDLAQSDQQKANDLAGWQGQKGQDLFNDVSGNLTNYGSQEQPLQGEAANLPGELGNFATYSGIAGPGGTAGDPYQLLPYEQNQFHAQQDAINQNRTASVARLKAQLGAAGIKEGDPAYSAAMAHLQQTHDQTLSAHNADFMEQSRGRRQAASGQLAQLQQSLAGYQHGVSQDRFGNALNQAQLGNSMVGGAQNTFQNSASLKNNIGQQARQNSAASDQFWQGIIGGAAGGAFPGFNPFGTPQVGQNSGYTPTQGNSGGQYPYGAFYPPQADTNTSFGSNPPQGFDFGLPEQNIFRPTTSRFKTGFETK